MAGTRSYSKRGISRYFWFWNWNWFDLLLNRTQQADDLKLNNQLQRHLHHGWNMLLILNQTILWFFPRYWLNLVIEKTNDTRHAVEPNQQELWCCWINRRDHSQNTLLFWTEDGPNLKFYSIDPNKQLWNSRFNQRGPFHYNWNRLYWLTIS